MVRMARGLITIVPIYVPHYGSSGNNNGSYAGNSSISAVAIVGIVFGSAFGFFLLQSEEH